MMAGAQEMRVPKQPRVLMITMADAAKALSGK